jgi:hypothetical protein
VSIATRSLHQLLATPSRLKRALLASLILASTSVTAWAIVTNLGLVALLHEPATEEHGDQLELLTLVESNQDAQAFTLAFDTGDELFETRFNALDGGGANVGQGQRFTRVPRADLAGPGEWAKHTPARATGPNAETCLACHNEPVNDGAGLASSNVHRDPRHSGNLGSFIQRNTPHLFAPGAIQRLAEEMTEELHRARTNLVNRVCSNGGSASTQLTAKGISFGVLKVTRTGTNPCRTTFDTSQVTGVSADLVVRPFQWKGSVAFVRDFNRDASHNELGMQAVEMNGDGVDGDGDGVANEMTIGDQTALAVYMAAQPRPTTKLELNDLGLLDPPLTTAQKQQINRGRDTFSSIGCARCHTPRLKINDPIFSEPSQNPNFRDAVFPGGQDPVAVGVDPSFPVTFDLTRDQPDNQVTVNGRLVRLGSLKTDDEGRAIVELLGDLRRHDMGPGLAESIDEVGTGASVFLTENLWGVGSTAPYLHDGRATTLTEAILEHGGEASNARSTFVGLSTSAQRDVIAFLENLVLFRAL